MVALTLRGDVRGCSKGKGPLRRRASRRSVATEGRRRRGGAVGQDEAADRSGGRRPTGRGRVRRCRRRHQTGAVETFRNSHEKLSRYDALAAADVEEMKANKTALQGMADRAADLAPPRKYEEQHEVFSAAIDELRKAARLATAWPPIPSPPPTAFDEYEAASTRHPPSCDDPTNCRERSTRRSRA